MDDVIIRLATDSDATSLGRLGAQLLETHYSFDAKRFMAPLPNSSEGYASFLRSQLRHDDVVVFDRFDDVRAHGAPRVLLWTAEQNPAAQTLFGRLGFRRTMIEMTRELD